MAQTSSPLAVWVVIGAGVLLANLPFLTDRVFGLVRDGRKKTLGWQFAELWCAYMVFVGLTFAVEHHLHGGVYAKGWVFWTVSASLFLVGAFPGFVWRHVRQDAGRTPQR